MRVVLAVSDPWGLGEAIEWQPIPGSVVHMEGDVWLVKVDAPFVHSDIEYHYLIASPRHAGSTFVQAGLKQVPYNVIRISAERALSATPCDLAWWRGGGAMIGAITVEKSDGHQGLTPNEKLAARDRSKP